MCRAETSVNLEKKQNWTTFLSIKKVSYTFTGAADITRMEMAQGKKKWNRVGCTYFFDSADKMLTARDVGLFYSGKQMAFAKQVYNQIHKMLWNTEA